MYAGLSPETLALFAEALGAKEVENKFYQEAISERSSLKRRLERKSIKGYSGHASRFGQFYYIEWAPCRGPLL